MTKNQSSSHLCNIFHSNFLARQIADEALRRLYTSVWTGIRYIELDKLARLWGLAEVPSDFDYSFRISHLGLDGIMQDSTQYANRSGVVHLMKIFNGKGTYRRRFTIAHEIAHVVCKTVFSSKLSEFSGADLERDVIDPAAGMIALPDQLLFNYFPKESTLTLTIQLLEETSSKMRVSISTLVKRLGDVSRSNIVFVDNGALVAQLGRARKSGKYLAPRVVVSCLPSSWFLPSNKRLSSLGAESLSAQFSKAELYKERESRDRITFWNRSSWTRQKIEVHVGYKCYRTGDERVMLVVIKEPRLATMSR